MEVQQTVHEPPPAKTLARGRAEAPTDFEFSMNAWKPLTHPSTSSMWRRLKDRFEHPEQAGYFQPFAAVNAAWKRAREAAKLLRVDIALFQYHAGFTPIEAQVDNLLLFLRSIGRGKLRFAWKPRGNWPENLIAEICEDLGLIRFVAPLKQRTLNGETA